ncbi:hypothetical protein [Planosporangium mesophilum]|uniref:Uncharacterized protein n=1 Tax=Planosporangium mesophilum TaxID=689768 RepID=A0A8J3T9B2_9ACTN|nr:hypothetical protein [Planosporangium mesophilum]NJC81350.1 hypothetical protein [Planosporangium mesophilum]GII20997.1 hypothetical protein Pme01_05940 [Planosporangium mesophilum]
MAVLGSIVTYGVSAADEDAFSRRVSRVDQVRGGSHPVAGDEVSALVIKHYGGDPGAEVADLVVKIDGMGPQWLGSVRQGAKGEQGRWW